MNFLSVTETVERARIKATLAAKKLNLNEMAKNDDYIHSEGLNTNNKNHNHSRGGGGGKKTNRKEEVLNNFDLSRNVTEDDDDDDDDDDDSVDSYDRENDPILQYAKIVKKQTFSTTNKTTGGAFPPPKGVFYYNNENFNATKPNSSSCNVQQGSKKKDPNRFMADLDARLSTPTNIMQASNQIECVEEIPREENNVFDSFTKSENKLNWLRHAVSSPKIQQSFTNVIKQVPGIKYDSLPNEDTTHKNDDGHDDIEMARRKKTIQTSDGEKITVVTSSSLALLDNDAKNELQRLNQLMNKSKRNFCLMGLEWMEKHRNYALIIITFILTLVGFWYSRKKNEENVT